MLNHHAARRIALNAFPELLPNADDIFWSMLVDTPATKLARENGLHQTETEMDKCLGPVTSEDIFHELQLEMEEDMVEAWFDSY